MRVPVNSLEAGRRRGVGVEARREGDPAAPLSVHRELTGSSGEPGGAAG